MVIQEAFIIDESIADKEIQLLLVGYIRGPDYMVIS